jgi:hypothetical protein
MNPESLNPEHIELRRKLYHNHGAPIVSRLARALPLATRRERRKLLRQIQKQTPQAAPVAASTPVASSTEQNAAQIPA